MAHAERLYQVHDTIVAWPAAPGRGSHGGAAPPAARAHQSQSIRGARGGCRNGADTRQRPEHNTGQFSCGQRRTVLNWVDMKIAFLDSITLHC